MNWNEIVKTSEGYWKPTESPWKFCGMCCLGDQPIYKPSESDPQKRFLYENEKKITHYWSKEDDRKLIKLAEKYNCDWETISERFTDKTAQQLSRRWKNKLDPNTKQSPWTDEEDVVLKTLVLEFGYEWEKIAKHIQGRTPNSIKKRFMNSVLPILSQKEFFLLQERLNPKIESQKYSMDIDSNSIQEQNKEEYLQLLHKKVDDLQSVMRNTLEQIEKLESELTDSQSLLS
ncbi:hypothetical protein SteCoe_36002 [Stentor coeruleus]|uniref:Myb-like DNA-binding domain containing protein n=1 Tax=Stentor coeruleus TaxID=5963 RepID=A0A1R2AR43_9CILI|nr:hypothetical protein SteCoe_36002 [Stentor coeruleus]